MDERLPEYGLFIDGAHVVRENQDWLSATDPATGVVFGRVAAANEHDVDSAVAAASDAAGMWGTSKPAERAAVLRAAAILIRQASGELSELESLDTGKPLKQARADVETAAEYCEFYAGAADKFYGDTIPLGPDNFAVNFPEPLGVTAHIIPWNYPIQICARTTTPSLAAGNTCVVKPAEEASLSALRFAQLMHDAGLPPGALNVVPGRGEVAGQALARHWAVDHVAFTGSVDTGKEVMRSAAERVVPVTLELGGKSPHIVLPDADLPAAAKVITAALIQNAGQTCSAGTRVIVHQRVHEQLVALLVEAFEGVSVGRGLDDPDMGPLISQAQFQRVKEYVALGEAEGATLLSGGTPTGAGHFIPPTLFDRVEPAMRIAQEEIFGPVLAVLSFDTPAEAVEIANETPYGLISAIWTQDVDIAMWMARHLQCGQVYVNSYGAGGGVGLPFGGIKQSGFGREKGMAALGEYTQLKCVAFAVRDPVRSTMAP